MDTQDWTDAGVDASGTPQRMSMLQTCPELQGCSKPGHPNRYAHDCDSWDEAIESMRDWEIPGREAQHDPKGRANRSG